MSNSLEKIQKLLKSADMPLLPGSKRVNKRNLNWIRFDRNVLLQNLSKLPDPVKAALSKKLDEFYQEFQKLPSGELRKYAGMLWVLYADDRSITDDILLKMKNEGGAIGRSLLETAKFAQRNAMQLTSAESFGKSRGEMIDKNIGSDYWLSMFGYAYQGINGYNVIRRKNDIPRRVMPNPSNKPYEKPNGPLELVEHGEGFRLVIRTNNGDVPAYVGQSVQNFSKYFKGENLFINKSVVYIPPSGFSNIVSSDIAARGEPDFDSGYIFQIPNKEASRITKEDENQKKFIWGVYVDEDGVFFLQQRNTYGGGAGGARPVGPRIPMTINQINSIINSARIGVNHVIFPSESNFSEDELSDTDIVTGTKYVYMMDEETKQKIRNPDPSNPSEWAISAPALSKLKTFLDLQKMNNEEDPYTAFEGFLLYMVGPVFANAKNLGQGKAIGRPLTTDPKYVSVEQDKSSNGVIADRDVTWVVLANRISEQRRILNDRNNRLDLWQKIAETDDLQEALDIMVSRASENGGDIPRISSNASSVSPAQKSLEESAQMPASQRFEPMKNTARDVPQINSNPSALPSASNLGKDEKIDISTASVMKIIRRMTKNV